MNFAVDSNGNYDNFGSMSEDGLNIDAIGDSLLKHSEGAEFTAQRGVVESLYPYIVHASKRMSARAISKFLEEQHRVKVSYVTIGRALRQPQKYWNLYFDSVEASAWIIAEAHAKALKDFMSEPEKYQEILEQEPSFDIKKTDCKAIYDHAVFEATVDYDNAVRLLDEKWFRFDEVILEEARRHLLKRFTEKPADLEGEQHE